MSRPDRSPTSRPAVQPSLSVVVQQLAVVQDGAISRAQVLALRGTDEWLAA